MKIAVLVKRVPDTASVFNIQPDGKSVDLSGLKFVMSPYDEHAVEEAIQLRDKEGGEVIIVSAGSSDSTETIRTALAMGAEGRRIAERDFSLAVDSDGAQVPERVAELMGIPHASCVTKFALENGKAVVNREVEGGHYCLALELPALLTAQKGINTPRYPTLPNIMKAKRKPVEEVAVADLSVDAALLQAGMAVENLSLPRQDRLCKVLAGELSEQVSSLYRALREEEKVLQ